MSFIDLLESELRFLNEDLKHFVKGLKKDMKVATVGGWFGVPSQSEHLGNIHSITNKYLPMIKKKKSKIQQWKKEPQSKTRDRKIARGEVQIQKWKNKVQAGEE